MKKKSLFIIIFNALSFLIILFAFTLNLSSVYLIHADEEECEEIDCDKYKDDDRDKFISCIEDKQECYQDKIDQTQAQAQTLKNTISVLNGEIYLQELKVVQTKAEIEKLEKDIDDLSNRIEGLATSLDHLAGVLITRVQNDYKSMRTDSLLSVLVSGNLRETVNFYQYRSKIQNSTVLAMQQAEYQRLTYNEQKTVKEEKQQQLESKKAVLVEQQNDLSRQKKSKQGLLTETQNNEERYQKLLAEAQAEVASYKSFAKSQVGTSTCLSSSPDKEDDYYYSQRDPRWCKQHIGYSSEVMGDVGCLITSVAMIWAKHGHDRKPSQFAANPIYFSLRTAYMRAPLPTPPGYRYYRYDRRDFSIIDSELEQDRPVIVHLRIGTYDGHFVVLTEGSNGNYKMFDPFYGADLDLNDKYSSSMISSIRVFKP